MGGFTLEAVEVAFPDQSFSATVVVFDARNPVERQGLTVLFDRIREDIDGRLKELGTKAVWTGPNAWGSVYLSLQAMLEGVPIVTPVPDDPSATLAVANTPMHTPSTADASSPSLLSRAVNILLLGLVLVPVALGAFAARWYLRKTR
jgi:hypothetical protein